MPAESRYRRDALRALGVDVYRSRAPTAACNADTSLQPDLISALEITAPIPALALADLLGGDIPFPNAASEPRKVDPFPRKLPHDWDGLRALVKDCPDCKLCQTRTQTVFGTGAENAPLMVVGEGPGADEDAQGEPFVGRAGKLLDEMLRAIGHGRGSNTYIANVVKCRPPGNRDPEKDEVEACRGYLDRQIELVKPKLILALGRIAAQRLLGTEEPLSRLRGPFHAYGPLKTPVFVTYHPAYLLRSPREKAKSWDDLKKAWQHLNAAPVTAAA